jgi:hypothetical protein
LTPRKAFLSKFVVERPGFFQFCSPSALPLVLLARTARDSHRYRQERLGGTGGFDTRGRDFMLGPLAARPPPLKRVLAGEQEVHNVAHGLIAVEPSGSDIDVVVAANVGCWG